MGRFCSLCLLLMLVAACPGRAQTPAGSPSPPASALPPILTLDEAVRLAAQDNRKVANSRIEVQKNEDLLAYQERQRLPNLKLTTTESKLLTPLDFNLAEGALGTYPTIGPIPASNISVAHVTGAQNTFRAIFSQPLSQLHVIGLQVGLQQDEVNVAVQQNRNDAQNVTTQVKQLYYDLLDTQTGIGAVRDNIEFYREFYRVTAEFLKQQATLKSDLLEVKANLLSQQAQLVSLENTQQQQSEQMNILLARDISTAFRVEDPTLASGVQESLESLVQEAMNQRPEVLESRLKIKEAETNREIKRAAYIPDVSLDVVYQRSTNNGLLPPEQAFMLLRAEFDAVDFGRRDAQIAAEDKQVQVTVKELADTQAQVASDVNTRFRKLAQLKAEEAAKAAFVEATEEKQRITLNRFLQKAAITKDVLDAQAQLSQARRAYRKLQLDIAAAVADLYKAVGRDL